MVPADFLIKALGREIYKSMYLYICRIGELWKQDPDKEPKLNAILGGL